MSGARRFTASAEAGWLTFSVDGQKTPAVHVGALAEPIAAQVNGTVTDDLPPGVHEIDGRLWLLPEHPLPEGWQARTYEPENWSPEIHIQTRFVMFEVRRVPAPEVERVPWHEAVARTATNPADFVGLGCPLPNLPHEISFVHRSRSAWSGKHSIQVQFGGTTATLLPADGTVEVLVEGEPS